MPSMNLSSTTRIGDLMDEEKNKQAHKEIEEKIKSVEELKAMNKRKDKMDYLAWSRVIDELEAVISTSKMMIETNSAFLEQAIIKRDFCEKPKVAENPIKAMTG